MNEPVEVYLLSGHSSRCFICSPTVEALVAGFYGDGFTLCPHHLLRLQAIAATEAGERVLRALEREDV